MFVDAEPGERVSRTILVKNGTRADASIRARALDMRAGPGPSTAFDYLPAGEAPRGAGGWISPSLPGVRSGTLLLRAGTEARTRVDITVPADAGAGGHYAAIMFTGQDPRGAGQLQGDIEVPVPVLLSIGGDPERELHASVRADDRFRWRGGRTDWTVELHNRGDVHEVFGGRLRVDGLASGARRLDLRPGILLPGERRTVRLRDVLRASPDRVDAELEVARADGEPIRRTASPIYVLPWWLLVLLGLALVLVAARVRARRAAWRAYYAELHDADVDEEHTPAGSRRRP